MKNNIFRAIWDKKQDNLVDERETLEFNSIITFCFTFLVLSLVFTSFIYKPYLAKYIHEDAICLYLIGLTCFIGSIKLCNKGIIVLNKNYQILYPVFLFFPFFPLKMLEITLSFFNVDIPFYLRVLLTFIFLIVIYILINQVYLNGVRKIDSTDE